MQILAILAHPNADSFNHAIAAQVCATLRELGHGVILHDLYAEGFDPILPAAEIPRDAPLTPEIALHCRELAAADGIVVIHPNWWGQPPAILKGWVDRVLRPGVAYRFQEGDAGDGVPIGLLKARVALVLNTANTPPEREQAAFGDPLQALWKRCIFDLCGVPNFYRETFAVVVTSGVEQRRAWLAQVRDLMMRCFPRHQET
jgi:NAD(P)H dehydrogenase (quinone)